MPRLPKIWARDRQPLSFGGRAFAIESVHTTMRREAARFRFTETGGLLLGYRVKKDIVLTEATGPGPHAIHAPTFFKRDTLYCQGCLDEAYQRTEGAVTYMGEWHTHPHAGTHPSRRDVKAMTEIAQDVDYRQPEPVVWIYRPADTLLPWCFSEEQTLWVFNERAEARRVAEIHWFAQIPGA